MTKNGLRNKLRSVKRGRDQLLEKNSCNDLSNFLHGEIELQHTLYDEQHKFLYCECLFSSLCIN